MAGPEALKTFQEAPEKMATLVEVQDNNSLTHFHYSVQDSPGDTRAYLQHPSACAAPAHTYVRGFILLA